MQRVGALLDCMSATINLQCNAFDYFCCKYCVINGNLFAQRHNKSVGKETDSQSSTTVILSFAINAEFSRSQSCAQHLASRSIVATNSMLCLCVCVFVHSLEPWLI